MWDIVRYARENGILCQGRGSAANSLVAYLLNISPINPLAHDLVFERFLSEERPNMPDIDIDFQADRREEVIQYVYTKYGRQRAAMACTFITFRSRIALREVGKALGLPEEMIDENAGRIRARNPTDAGMIDMDKTATISTIISQDVITLCNQIYGLPRHLGIHNGGMIIPDTYSVRACRPNPRRWPIGQSSRGMRTRWRMSGSLRSTFWDCECSV